MSTKIILIVSLLAALVPLSGCTGGEKLPTVPVTGTVTYNGAPLDGAEVSFLPKEHQDGARGASGTTDAQGNFKLQTFLGGDKTVAGALPGDYAVTVRKRENIGDRMRANISSGGHAQGREVMDELGKEVDQPAMPGGPPGRGGPPGGGGPPKGMPGTMIGKPLVPEKYEAPHSSGLTATVKQSGNEPFKFELAD